MERHGNRMKFFSVDGALYKFLSRLWDMVKLNFMWLLFSLPVVTVGAATVAAYSVTLKMVDEQEGYVARQFVKAFKENWRQGIPMGLLALFCSYDILRGRFYWWRFWQWRLSFLSSTIGLCSLGF